MNIRGGQLVQSNLNPAWPGTHVTGPLLAGNIVRSGGSNIAGLLSQDQGALGNVGFARMVQVGRVTQATNGSSAGVFQSPDLIIPAQSLITSIDTIPLTNWNGAATTFGLGFVGAPTALTAAGAVSGVAGVSTAIQTITGAALLNWINVGNNDVQIQVTSTNTGAGVGLVIVSYIQGINAPTS